MKRAWKMHFSARSQWNEMCFVHQRIIFQGEKRKVSLKLMVRLGGITPPPNIYIIGKLWIMAISCAYPFTLPKFLQALRILLTPWDSNDHTSWDCVIKMFFFFSGAPQYILEIEPWRVQAGKVYIPPFLWEPETFSSWSYRFWETWSTAFLPQILLSSFQIRFCKFLLKCPKKIKALTNCLTNA